MTYSPSPDIQTDSRAMLYEAPYFGGPLGAAAFVLMLVLTHFSTSSRLAIGSIGLLLIAMSLWYFFRYGERVRWRRDLIRKIQKYDPRWVCGLPGMVDTDQGRLVTISPAPAVNDQTLRRELEAVGNKYAHTLAGFETRPASNRLGKLMRKRVLVAEFVL